MIEINFGKWMDLFFIVCSAFVVAGAGNYFFQWDFEFGLLVGIGLGVWNSLYDMLFNIVSYFQEVDEAMEEMEEVSRKVVPKEIEPEDDKE